MAKATLPTNYRDDILNVSTEGKRKYRMNYNDDGTVSFIDVTPYDQEGSDFGAGDINRTNEAVNQSFDKNKLIRDMDAINALTQEGYAPDALALKDVNDSLGGVSQFIVDETTGKITGYKTSIGGADTVFPFSSFITTEVFTIHNGTSVTSGTAPSVTINLSAYTDNLYDYDVHFVTKYVGTGGNARTANITCTVTGATTVSVSYPVSANCTAYLNGYFILTPKSN